MKFTGISETSPLKLLTYIQFGICTCAGNLSAKMIGKPVGAFILRDKSVQVKLGTPVGAWLAGHQSMKFEVY